MREDAIDRAGRALRAALALVAMSASCAGSSVRSREPVRAGGPEPGRAAARAVAVAPPHLALCDPARPQPRGYGVAVACESPANPVWVWNTSPGALGSIQLPTRTPDCRHFAFDAHGNPTRSPATPEGDESITAWEYDALGRLVARHSDRPAMCEASAGSGRFHDRYFRACGPPDGVWDDTTQFRWSELPDGSLEVSVVGVATSWLQRFDSRGRLTLRQTASEYVRREYELGIDPVRVIEGNPGAEPRRESHTRYDAAGSRVESESNFAGGARFVSRWTYDAFGNEVRVETEQTSPARHSESTTWDREYDAEGRPVRQVFHAADGRTTVFERRYGAHGFLVSETRREGAESHTVEWVRDEDGSLRALRVDGYLQQDYRCLVPLWRVLTAADTGG